MELLTKKEAAELLKVTERTIDNYVAQGMLIAYYPGGAGGKTVRFKRAEVENFFQPSPEKVTNG